MPGTAICPRARKIAKLRANEWLQNVKKQIVEGAKEDSKLRKKQITCQKKLSAEKGKKVSTDKKDRKKKREQVDVKSVKTTKNKKGNI